MLLNCIHECGVINFCKKRWSAAMEIAKCAAGGEGNALNLSLRRMHGCIKPAVRDYIIGVTTVHVKVITHQRSSWKLTGIINEKWDRSIVDRKNMCIIRNSVKFYKIRSASSGLEWLIYYDYICDAMAHFALSIKWKNG